MVHYGGREFYGGMPSRPTSAGQGQLNFENGDITYCPTNNTLAIFYAQTDRPNLTMEVIPVGKVTSGLSVFDEMESRVEYDIRHIFALNRNMVSAQSGAIKTMKHAKIRVLHRF